MEFDGVALARNILQRSMQISTSCLAFPHTKQAHAVFGRRWLCFQGAYPAVGDLGGNRAALQPDPLHARGRQGVGEVDVKLRRMLLAAGNHPLPWGGVEVPVGMGIQRWPVHCCRSLHAGNAGVS